MKKSGVIISIILPTYNRPQLFERALRSVIASHCTHTELIVVNDGSEHSHRTEYRRIYDAYADSLMVLELETNGGVADARNRGIERAAGEWILFLDDDDKLADGYLVYLEKNLPAFSGKADLIWPDVYIQHHRHGQSFKTRKMFMPDTKSTLLSDLLSIGTGYGVVIRKQVLDAVRGFDSACRVSEDTDLFFRLLQYGISVAHVKKYGVIIHEHEEAKLTDSFSLHAREHIFRNLFRKYNAFLQKDSGLYTDFSVWVITVYVRNGMMRNAAAMCFELLFRRLFHAESWRTCFFQLRICAQVAFSGGKYA